MEELRATTPDERRALKSAVSRAAKIAGGAASVQHVTRVSEHDLCKYAAQQHGDRHCPIDVALDLDREAGSPIIVSQMARLLGFRLVADDREGGAIIEMRDLALISSDAARVIEDVTNALANGEIDAAEDRQIGLDIETAVRDLRALQDKAHMMRLKGRG